MVPKFLIGLAKVFSQSKQSNNKTKRNPYFIQSESSMLKKSDSNMINDETFSSRDDELLEALDLNSHLLSHFSFYATPNLTEFIAEAVQTDGVVGSVVDRLVQEGSKRLYDKYIGTKLPNHVLMVSKEYLETLSAMEFQNHDRSEMGAETLAEDPEPVLLMYWQLRVFNGGNGSGESWTGQLGQEQGHDREENAEHQRRSF